MINIERKQEIESVMIKETMWDLKRVRSHKVKIFGLTVYSWGEDHRMDIDQNENSVGFRNGKK